MRKRVFSGILAIIMLFSLLPANLAAATMAEVTEETDPALVSAEKGEFGTISLRYDDYLDLSGKTVEIVDAGTPTSYRVGYGVEENAVADEAVVRMEGDTLVACGVGTAQIRIDGVLTEITVEAAPISVLLLIGQSNMQGSEGDENQSIVCPDGMVYATYGDRYTMTVDNATDFAPSALTGDGSLLNVNGNADHYADWPVYLLNEKGVGKKGPDSGFAYEWVRQTGEKVWVINAAHGGSSITTWQKTGDNYKECVLLFRACMETMEKEIAAGHYTLSHLGYFWCQGCTDYSQSAAWYVEKYLAMHENLKTDLAFQGRSFEFGGIIPVRAGHESYISYRQGVYTDTTTRAYHESFKDLRFTGPRVAQYWMTNNPDLPDIWNVCNIGEDWVWMPDGTNGVSAYFRAHYPNGTVDYTTQVQQETSWYTPTTPKAVHDSIHYNQIGYNEVGREAARNALILLGEIEAPDTETTVKFLTWDGYSEANEIAASSVGNSGTLVVPKVYPVWRSKEVTYQLTDGLRYAYYDLLAESPLAGGTLTAAGADGSVSVAARALTSFRWDLEDGLLVSTGESENRATRLAGSTENGVFIDTRYQLEKPFVLLNDENWVLEWKMTGPWYDDDSATSKKIFCEDGASATSGSMYLLVSGRSNFIGIGYFGPSTHIAYGVNLSEHGISVADTHIYRLANHIKADGSNEIILFVDGQQIGAMTRYFTGSSGDMGTESNYLSGKSFTFGYMGTPKYLLDNGVIEYVSVVESDADPDIHFHDWSDWETVTAPGPEGPGLERRSCPCGATEERTVTSVWQTTNLAQYYQALPDPCCCGLNLWSVLRHDPVYYVNSQGDWAYHSSGNVPSITIPVQPGDRIYATSFGKAGENGHSSSNGIRVTWFDINGVVKTTDPAGTYAEFCENGGYLIAPESAISVNIPLWNSSDDNEIKVLNRNHIYENGVCTACGDVSVWRGRSAVFVGDSITAGTGTTKIYYQYLEEALGFGSATAMGVAGSCISAASNYGQANQPLINRYNNIPSADLIVVFMGTNDYGHETPLGTAEDTQDGSFYGALNAVIPALAAEHPSAKIVFVTPLHRYGFGTSSILGTKFTFDSKPNGVGATLGDYVQALKEVCAENGISVIDLYTECALDPADAAVRTEYMPDGLHPNAAGHALIAGIMESHILGYAPIKTEPAPTLEGRTVSILGASVCTYKNVSNGTAADTTNSTIRNGALYYPSSKIPEVGLDDTWWMQLIDDLGLRLLVNNSWSGSALLHTRRGTVGAYVDRCVQLHDDTGDNAGEEPDIILIQMGTNDFQYYKDTLGTEADIDYDALIIPNGDGTYQYAEPTTTAEAQAITLHKISVRYPNAEVYYLNATHRVDGTDDLAADYYANQAAVSAHFGVPVASIYDSEIRAENFDRYIGDGRVHPNNYGMDVYTETVKATILANTAYAHPDAHTVHYALENVAADYGTDKLVLDGAPFSAVLTPEGGYDALSVKVLMGGEDITAACYADGTVTIGSVTADVTVAATAVRTPKTYRWESDGAELVPVTADGLTENALTRLNGTTADGVFSSTQYALERAVMLQHDLPWELEWTCAGDWRGIVFSSRQKQQTTGMTYLSRTSGGMLCFGTWTGQQHDNYGVDLSGLDDQTHTFRLKNRIADDGSNMVWLYVDGAEIGPMNNYYVGSSSQNATSDWLSGRDFSFSYIGVEGHELNNCRLEYLEIQENSVPCDHLWGDWITTTPPTCIEPGEETRTCSLCGASETQRVEALGHDIVTDIAVAPTCTETGLTEGSHCTRCDYKVAQEVVSALGHNLVTDAAVAPTYTETGLTEGTHCTRCDYRSRRKSSPRWDTTGSCPTGNSRSCSSATASARTRARSNF